MAEIVRKTDILRKQLEALAAIKIDWPEYRFENSRLTFTKREMRVGDLLGIRPGLKVISDQEKVTRKHLDKALAPLHQFVIDMRQQCMADFHEAFPKIDTREIEAFFDGKYPARDALSRQFMPMPPGAEEDPQFVTEAEIDRITEHDKRIDMKIHALPPRDEMFGEKIAESCIDSESRKLLSMAMGCEFFLNNLQAATNTIRGMADCIALLSDLVRVDAPDILIQKQEKTLKGRLADFAGAIDELEKWAFEMGGQHRGEAPLEERQMAEVAAGSLRTIQIALEKTLGAPERGRKMGG